MAKLSIKYKISFIFVLIVFLVNLAIISVIILLITPKLKSNFITLYKQYITDIKNNSIVTLARYTEIGNIISDNLSTFYSQNNLLELSDTYLDLISRGLLDRNEYVVGIAYSIKADLDLSITPENFIDTSFIYKALWFKDLNQQIHIVKYDPQKTSTQDLLLEAKNKHTYVLGEPFVFSSISENTLIQPIAFPIYVGSKYYGSVVLFISNNFLKEITAYLNLPQNADFFIFTQKGKILNYYPQTTPIGLNFYKLYPNFSGKFISKIYQAQPINEKYKNKLVITDYAKITPNSYWVIGSFIDYSTFSMNLFKTILLLLIANIIISFTVYFVVRILSGRLAKLTRITYQNLNNIYRGKLDYPVEIVSYFQEIQDITLTTEKIRQRLLKLTEIISGLKDRKYDVKLEYFDKNDKLANTINAALEALEARAQKRENIEQIQQRNEWINKGLNEIYNATHLALDNIENLSNNVLLALIKYVDAFLGGIFVLNEETNLLEPSAVFAYEDPKVINKKIQPGEGIIGAVALERKPMYLTAIPQDYKFILLGLGETKPQSVFIQPLIYENELLGVLELAFLRKLKEYEREFIEKAALSIAQAIKSIKVNIQTKQLLKQVQERREELENVQKQLKKHIKELEEKQKVLKEQQVEMQGIYNAINHTLLTVEYTTEGKILKANERYLKTMGYKLEELVGRHVTEFVSKEQESELLELIEKIKQGQSIEKIIKRPTKLEEIRWLYATYTPFYNSEGKITKILFFAFDITETYIRIQKLEEQVKTLNKQLALLEESLKDTNQNKN